MQFTYSRLLWDYFQSFKQKDFPKGRMTIKKIPRRIKRYIQHVEAITFIGRIVTVKSTSKFMFYRSATVY